MYDRAAQLYGAAVEEFQGLVCADAEQGGNYMGIVVKHAEVLHHRAERIRDETGVPERIQHALHLLRVRI